MELAREIVSIFYDDEAAQARRAALRHVFQQHALPDDMPAFTVTHGMSVVDVIMALNFAASKGEARRLVAGGGVYLDGRTLTDPNESPQPPQILQVGKRRFAKLVASENPKGLIARLSAINMPDL